MDYSIRITGTTAPQQEEVTLLKEVRGTVSSAAIAAGQIMDRHEELAKKSGHVSEAVLALERRYSAEESLLAGEIADLKRLAHELQNDKRMLGNQVSDAELRASRAEEERSALQSSVAQYGELVKEKKRELREQVDTLQARVAELEADNARLAAEAERPPLPLPPPRPPTHDIATSPQRFTSPARSASEASVALVHSEGEDDHASSSSEHEDNEAAQPRPARIPRLHSTNTLRPPHREGLLKLLFSVDDTIPSRTASHSEMTDTDTLLSENTSSIDVSTVLRIRDSDTMMLLCERAGRMLETRHGFKVDMRAMCLRVGHAEVVHAPPLSMGTPCTPLETVIEASRKTREYRCDSGRELRSFRFLQRWVDAQPGPLFHITATLVPATAEVHAKQRLRSARARCRAGSMGAAGGGGGGAGSGLRSARSFTFKETSMLGYQHERFRSPPCRMPPARHL